MQPATGPLTTGTYVIHFHATKHIAAVRSDGTIAPIKNKAEADAEVRTTGKYDSFTQVNHTHGAVIRQECEPNEWIMKESEITGIYQ